MKPDATAPLDTDVIVSEAQATAYFSAFDRALTLCGVALDVGDGFAAAVGALDDLAATDIAKTLRAASR